LVLRDSRSVGVMQGSRGYQHETPRSYLLEDLNKIGESIDDQHEREPWSYAQSDSRAPMRERREQNQLYQDEFYLYEVGPFFF
jgi:hypothetical protein